MRRTVGIALMLLGVLAHAHWNLGYLRRLDCARTLYPPPGRAPLPPAPGPAPRRVWVVIADGLRDDVGGALPHVLELAERGARRRLISELPSFTRPNITTMSTGVPPIYSGARFNSDRPHARLDTLVAASERAGRPVVLARPGFLERALDAERGPRAFERAVPDEVPARAPRREWVWLYLPDADHEAHWHGADSPEYRRAAARVDELIGRLAAALDPAQDLLVVVSDHGHRARGGHGGSEPEVRGAFFLAWGARVRQHVALPARPMRDLAPTLALLAGLAPPADALGRPMLDVLDASPGDAARALAPAYAARVRADAALAEALAAASAQPERRPAGPETGTLLAALAAGDPSALAPAEAELAARSAASDEALAAVRARALGARLPLAALLIAAIVLGLAWLRRRLGLEARDLAPLLVHGALLVAGLALAGYSLGWTMPRGTSGWLRESAVLGLVVGGLAVWALGRTARLAGRRVEQAAASLVLLVPYLVAWTLAGSDPRLFDPERHGFAFLAIATWASLAWLCLGAAALTRGLRSASSRFTHEP